MIRLLFLKVLWICCISSLMWKVEKNHLLSCLTTSEKHIHLSRSFLFDGLINSFEHLPAMCEVLLDAVGTAQSRAGGLPPLTSYRAGRKMLRAVLGRGSCVEHREDTGRPAQLPVWVVSTVRQKGCMEGGQERMHESGQGKNLREEGSG